jgi:hypothetical protein
MDGGTLRGRGRDGTGMGSPAASNVALPGPSGGLAAEPQRSAGGRRSSGSGVFAGPLGTACCGGA